MVAPDANKYSWEGLYSWYEPAIGNRLRWKDDPWRLAKLCLIPFVIFGVASFKRVDMSVEAILWLTAISAGLMFYIWLWTFAACFIRLFEDRLSIRSPGGRGPGGREIYYAEIESMEVVTKSPGYWITIKLKKKKAVTILARTQTAVTHLQDLYAGSRQSKHLANRS